MAILELALPWLLAIVALAVLAWACRSVLRQATQAPELTRRVTELEISLAACALRTEEAIAHALEAHRYAKLRASRSAHRYKKEAAVAQPAAPAPTHVHTAPAAPVAPPPQERVYGAAFRATGAPPAYASPHGMPPAEPVQPAAGATYELEPDDEEAAAS